MKNDASKQRPNAETIVGLIIPSIPEEARTIMANISDEDLRDIYRNCILSETIGARHIENIRALDDKFRKEVPYYYGSEGPRLTFLYRVIYQECARRWYLKGAGQL